MNRDKQIEEMCKDVYEAINHNRVIDVTHDCFIDVNTIGLTKELYEKGYRKSTDFAREVIDEFERRLYSVSHRETSITGYSYSVVDIDEIAYEAEELKKKYGG